jgi:hypothetical protein
MKSLLAGIRGPLRSYDRSRFGPELSARRHRPRRPALRKGIVPNLSRSAAAPILVTGYPAQTICAIILVMLAFLPLVLLLVKLWH